MRQGVVFVQLLPAQARKLRWFAHPRRGMVRGLIRYALMQQIERSGGIPW